jgi:hypothetical protein
MNQLMELLQTNYYLTDPCNSRETINSAVHLLTNYKTIERKCVTEKQMLTELAGQ